MCRLKIRCIDFREEGIEARKRRRRRRKRGRRRAASDAWEQPDVYVSE
jgi:hypothetical protein